MYCHVSALQLENVQNKNIQLAKLIRVFPYTHTSNMVYRTFMLLSKQKVCFLLQIQNYVFNSIYIHIDKTIGYTIKNTLMEY